MMAGSRLTLGAGTAITSRRCMSDVSRCTTTQPAVTLVRWRSSSKKWVTQQALRGREVDQAKRMLSC
jgi:hypothetical protein